MNRHPNAPDSGTATASLSAAQRQTLLQVARGSITHGLRVGRPLPVESSGYEAALQKAGASFVTLALQGQLRGCIGSLEPTRPLVEDVARNAFGAAFQDPRFPPLTEAEWPLITVHVSVLSPTRPLAFDNEQELLAQLRPGIDGLVIQDGPRRATFLPQVWEQLPEPRQFLAHLKRKAGLPEDYWSSALRAEVYQVEEFGD